MCIGITMIGEKNPSRVGSKGFLKHCGKRIKTADKNELHYLSYTFNCSLQIVWIWTTGIPKMLSFDMEWRDPCWLDRYWSLILYFDIFQKLQ